VRVLFFPGLILFLAACSPAVSPASAGALPTSAGRLAPANASPTITPPASQAQAVGGNNAYVASAIQKDCLLTGEPDGQSNQLSAPDRAYSFENDGKLFILFGESTSNPGTEKMKLRSTIPLVATFMFAVCALATPNVLAEAPPTRAVG
jgi:hypothetical protein